MNVQHISVSFGSTIPTQAYGNVQVNVAWAGDLAEDESPEAATRDLFDRIRLEVGAAVKPIAAAKLRAAKQVVESLPPKERDALMQQLGIIQWLEAVTPELKFAGHMDREDGDADPRND